MTYEFISSNNDCLTSNVKYEILQYDSRILAKWSAVDDSVIIYWDVVEEVVKDPNNVNYGIARVLLTARDSKND